MKSSLSLHLGSPDLESAIAPRGISGRRFIMTLSRFSVLVTTTALLHASVVSQVVAQDRIQPRAASQSVGAGRWQSQRDNLGHRDWQVQIQRFDDDSIEGSLIVIGSPTLHKVRLEGRVDGDEVYGALVGDSNRQVGSFTGSVFEGGVSGTYTTADGDSGSWSWAGPAGACSLKERGEKDIAESTP